MSLSSLGPVATTGQNLIDNLRILARDRQVDIPEFVVPSEGDVRGRRLRLHYLDWGNRDATPVIFAHPGRHNAHSWDIICLALRSRYRCIAVDAPGHGDSDHAPGMDYHLARIAEDMLDLVDGLGLDRYFLVGGSQGGLNVLSHALRFPKRVLGVVGCDNAPFMNRSGVLRQAGEMAFFGPFDTFEEIVLQSVNGRPTRNMDKLRFTISQNVRQLPDGRWAWKFDTQFRVTDGPLDLVPQLQELMVHAPSLRCPVRFLRGEHSDLLLPADAERSAAAFAHGSWGTIPSARHLLHFDNPNAVISELKQFLDNAQPQ